MASSPSQETASVSAPEPAAAPAKPAVSIIKKTIIFSPSDIKKIGLDKLIKAKVAPAKPAKQDNEEELEEDEVKLVPVSPKTQNMFCKNLKLKMQRVLQDKKITILAKKKAPDVISKKPSLVDGRKIKVMQNRVIQVAKKSGVDEGPVNGKKSQIVKPAPAAATQAKKATSTAYDFDEGTSPIFKAAPMRTYKRKRSDGEETPAKKVLAISTPSPAKKVVVANVPVEIPKKRGRKSKVEVAAMETDEEDDEIEIKLCNEDEDEVDDDEFEYEEDSEAEAEEIIIVQVPEKDNEDIDEEDEEQEDEEEGEEEEDEEIHFITDSVSAEETEVEDKSAMSKKPGRRSMAEIIQAIKKKRGRRSKSDQELLAKWDKDTKAKAKVKAKGRQTDDGADDDEDDEDDESDESDDEDEDEEEVEKIIMSPTRTGRVPKRNKLFDNFVTSSRQARKRSMSDVDEKEPKEKAPKVTVAANSSSNPTPKRGRGRPPKNKPVETPKKVDDDEKAETEAKDEKEKKDTVKKDVDEKGEAVHVTGDAEVIVIPKKRGRPAPKKVEVQQVEKVDQEEVEKDEEEEKVVVKRPRGRPAKVKKVAVVVATKDEDLESVKSDDAAETVTESREEDKDVISEETQSEDKSESKEAEEVAAENTVEEESKAEDVESREAVNEENKVEVAESKEESKGEDAEGKGEDSGSKVEETSKEEESSKEEDVTETVTEEIAASEPEKDETNVEESTSSETREDEEDDKVPEEESASPVKNGTDAEDSEKKTECLEEEDKVADSMDEKADSKAECDKQETNEAKEKEKDESKEAEVVAVRRRGGSPKKAADEPKVTVARSRKRKLERAESPSTSAADGVDEPSKRQKVDTSNVPVADLGATPKEEGANKKMYRILVANLVVNIRQRMAAAQDRPKGPGQTITCAICKIHCKKYEWATHKLRWHNNVTWKTTEEPLDLDNPTVVNSVLMLQYPKKAYICDHCNDSKKSALGFLTHKIQCNQSAERIKSLCVTCNICAKILLPYQLVEHDKAHKRESNKLQLQLNPDIPEAPADGKSVETPSKPILIPAIDPRPLTPAEVPIDFKSVQKTEGTYTKMHRLLIANLAVNIRERMANAVELPKQSGQNVTCAVCKVHCKLKDWPAHKLRWHNNVAWKTTEEPLDVDNYLVVQAALLLQYPSKPYICDFCNDSKKSALAYLTHKVHCNQSCERIESLRTPCDLCQKMLLPHHIVEHEKAHKKEAQLNEMRRLKMETAQDTDEDKTPRKRGAAARASLKIHEVTQVLSTGEASTTITYKILKRFFIRNLTNGVGVKAFIRNNLDKRGEVECLFGCGFKFNELAITYEHFENCQSKPEIYYICKLCVSVFEVLPDFRQHVTQKHAEEVQRAMDGDSFNADANDDDDDDDNVQYRYADGHASTAFWKAQKFAMVVGKSLKLPEFYPTGVNQLIYSKMLDFCSTHYTQQLFETFPFKKSTWFTVSKNYIAQYLPKMKLSIPIGYKTPDTTPTDQSFKRYKLFETSLVNDTATIYCGGPITAMAWAPTDYEQPECEQILAVAVQQDHDKRYSYRKNFAHKNMIQLWNFGVLMNKQPFTKPPELELGLAHLYGEVVSMEWCPSGCYEVRGTRLGLLAMCTTDGNVYCYSVGRSGSLNEKLFKPKPVFKLVASKEHEDDLKLGFQGFYPTQLSWSKATGHQFIAVAYSNGMVGMFNLHTESVILQDVDKNNVKVFYAYMLFKADRLEITAISLSHLGGGNRYVVTSSGTRQSAFWDLHSSTVRQTVLAKRSCSHKILWPVNTLTTVSCSDDCSSNAYLQLTTNNVAKIDFVRPTTMLFSYAAARTVDGSDWGGIIHLANEAGEVTCCTYRDMYPFSTDVPCKPYLCSNASVVVDDDAELSLLDRHKFHVIQKTHKVLFHDQKLDYGTNVKKHERSKHSLSCPDVKKFPLQAATVTCTNCNRFSFLFNAVGYNIGFVRVFHANFLNSSLKPERFIFNP